MILFSPPQFGHGVGLGKASTRLLWPSVRIPRLGRPSAPATTSARPACRLLPNYSTHDVQEPCVESAGVCRLGKGYEIGRTPFGLHGSFVSIVLLKVLCGPGIVPNCPSAYTTCGVPKRPYLHHVWYQSVMYSNYQNPGKTPPTRFFAEQDPGCTKYTDYGQRTHCKKTCGKCPPTAAEIEANKKSNPWNGAWSRGIALGRGTNIAPLLLCLLPI